MGSKSMASSLTYPRLASGHCPCRFYGKAEAKGSLHRRGALINAAALIISSWMIHRVKQ